MLLAGVCQTQLPCLTIPFQVFLEGMSSADVLSQVVSAIYAYDASQVNSPQLGYTGSSLMRFAIFSASAELSASRLTPCVVLSTGSGWIAPLSSLMLGICSSTCMGPPNSLSTLHAYMSPDRSQKPAMQHLQLPFEVAITLCDVQALHE